jgi:hypothetical protein
MIRPKSRAPRHQDPPGKRLDGSWEWLEVSPSPRHWCARLLRSLPPIFAAEQKFGPGVTDIEIKIGQTMPYSGPASAYSTVGVAQAAYFKMLNERRHQRPQDQFQFDFP